MAQATFSVRMDENLKNNFDILCSDFGMNISTAINIFARAVVREKRIPFAIVSSEQLIRENAINSFLQLRANSKKNFPNEMTLEQINEEIRQAREMNE